jgi:hypothetical protein
MTPVATENKSVEHNPTEYQPQINLRRFVSALLSDECCGNHAHAERLTGIDRGIFYYHHKNNPLFRKWYSEQCDRFLESQEALASRSLMRQVANGEGTALRTYYELRKKLKSNGNGNGNHQQQVLVVVKFPEEVEAEVAEVNVDSNNK